MLPAVRGILPRTPRVFDSPSKIMTLRVAEIPSGNMPDGASRMLALPDSTILHERTVIRNGRIVDPANKRDEIADLSIVDGRIADLSATRKPPPQRRESENRGD